MITTLLFDLDNTLLGNDMQHFLPAYCAALAESMQGLASARELSRALMAGAQQMQRNEDPRRTLREVFEGCFYPTLGLTPQDLAPITEHFYAHRFPTLQPLTRPHPAARRILDWAVAEGLAVDLISNPLFPRSAQSQRLAWAGVPPDDFPYTRLHGYETARFARPHPEFFAQTLAALNCPPGRALVVGDEWTYDILPAASLGIHTFWITGDLSRPPPPGADRAGDALFRAPPARPAAPGWATAPPTAQGTLEDLESWLKNGALRDLPEEVPPPAPALLPAL
ncbi:MAG: HAD family hydrolase, partial [Chloroflexi bacterium]|nr:HAD family hydrolase [Chloroflexota bacterium]